MKTKRSRPRKRKGRKLKNHPEKGAVAPLQQGNIVYPPTGPASANTAASVSATGTTSGTIVGA